MAEMLDGDRLRTAFVVGGLGPEEIYPWWTTLWGIRADLWTEEALADEARRSLGELVFEALKAGDSSLFTTLATALDDMLVFERKPENARRADVFFAIQELNHRGKPFSKNDLLGWLNEEMEALLIADEVEGDLEALGLADMIR